MRPLATAMRNPLVPLLAVVVLAGLVAAADIAFDAPVRHEHERPKPGKPHPTRAATLPPGIRVIDEPDGFEATRDVLPGSLRLPSGRVAIDGYFTSETEPLAQRAAPGVYPFHVTKARPVHGPGGAAVALATLVVSERPTVRWRPAVVIGVDGGIAAFSSAEGADEIAGLLPGRSHRWEARYQDFFDVMDATWPVGIAEVDDETNLAIFSTGLGDGGYGIYVGLDADGRPTQFVLDCGLIHLDWPKSPGPAKASPA
jgi:hypothetical protein